MDLLRRFQAYAAAFEETYLDDDWSRLEPYFSPNASYEVRGVPAFPINAQGRDRVFAALKDALDSFDRRCDSRKLDLLAPPKVDNDTVTIYWQGIYTLDGVEDLRIIGYEDAQYNDRGEIISLVDRYDEDAAAEMTRWMGAHREKLEGNG